MAYIIGNTTVIDDNGALGSVSGNSLNLANNANISAGGGLYTSYTSSTNAVSVPSISPSGEGAIVTLVGGGGGGGGGSNQPGSHGQPGRWAGHAVDIVDLGPVSNSTMNFAIGGGGNGGYYQPYGWSFPGNSGGATSVSTGQSAFGGGGGYKGMMPNPQGQPGYSGPRQGVGSGGAFTVYGYANTYDQSVNNHGRGGNAGGYRAAGNAGTAGVIRILGV